MPGTSVRMDALVLENSLSPAYAEGRHGVVPCLDHLGVPYAVADLAHSPLTSAVADYPLVIVAHRRIDPGGVRLGPEGRRRLLAAVAAGTGLVSFDPTLPASGEMGATRPARGATIAEQLRFASQRHYITARHEPEEELRLVEPLSIPPLAVPTGGVLVAGGGLPLVAAAHLGRGRVVQWATACWLHTCVLGPLAGLDDVLWRGLAWAARKPFALRGLGPLVAMRVDDVAGCGSLWQQSPLYWVRAANRFGLKPWLGLFIYNLSPEAVGELRELILRGQATAFPHAFGLRSRPDMPDVHYQGQIVPEGGSIDEGQFARRHGRRPWPSDLDEFIYFDHFRSRPWPDEEAAQRLAAVDEWYAAHAPLPISRYVVPHWYEMGRNTVAHVYDLWGARYCGTPLDLGFAYSPRHAWLKAGPFRRYENPGTGAIHSGRRGQRPVYYADWLNSCDRQFFNCLTEIRDDAGYDWKPDNDVSATVGRGVRQLRRALDSMALAVLVAHETDHIYDIDPKTWATEIEQVARGIVGYDPIYVTLDEAVRYVRATRTSRLESACFDGTAGTVSATFTGHADVTTHFYLFTEESGEIEQTLVEVPAFEGQVVVATRVRGR